MSAPRSPEGARIALAALRFRLARRLTALMFVLYFGFLLLIAYDKPLLGRLVAPGLSVGILCGALVILSAWALTGLYVAAVNRLEAELDGPAPPRGGAR